MRFAVATAILSHSSLHAASFEGKRSLGKFISHARGENFEALLKKKPSPLGTRQQKRTSQHQRRVAALKKKLQGKLERPLKNRREAKEVVECDPNALDLGVLACGSDQFCVKNRSSSKGGVCSSRRLNHTDDDGIYYDDYFFNPYCEYYYDNATETTTKACEYGYCSEGEGCCAEISYTTVIGADGLVSLAYATNFTEPYAQTGTLLLDETGCTVEIDGEICPCTFDTTFSTVDEVGFPCVAFECPSVLDGRTYDSCSPYNEGPWLPLLDYCFEFDDDYYDPYSDDFVNPCETYYDYETSTYVIYCTTDFYCSEDCCSESSSKVAIGADGVVSAAYASNFTEPYAQTGTLLLDSETGCTVEINGELCPCTFDPTFSTVDESGIPCVAFECPSVLDGLTYDSCSPYNEGTWLPLFEYCFSPYFDFDDEDPYFDDEFVNYPDCVYDYDYETYTETRTCIYTVCDEGEPCCYEYGYTSVLTPYAVESITFFGNITEPYAQTLSVTLEATGCTAVIGGETCLSCIFDGNFYGGVCFAFDCSNVIEGHTYDSCSEGEFILPVLETCEVSEEDDEAPIESPTESPEAPIESPTESPEAPVESPTESPVTSAAHLKSAASLVGFAAALVLYFGT